MHMKLDFQICNPRSLHGNKQYNIASHSSDMKGLMAEWLRRRCKEPMELTAGHVLKYSANFSFHANSVHLVSDKMKNVNLRYTKRA